MACLLSYTYVLLLVALFAATPLTASALPRANKKHLASRHAMRIDPAKLSVPLQNGLRYVESDFRRHSPVDEIGFEFEPYQPRKRPNNYENIDDSFLDFIRPPKKNKNIEEKILKVIELAEETTLKPEKERNIVDLDKLSKYNLNELFGVKKRGKNNMQLLELEIGNDNEDELEPVGLKNYLNKKRKLKDEENTKLINSLNAKKLYLEMLLKNLQNSALKNISNKKNVLETKPKQREYKEIVWSLPNKQEEADQEGTVKNKIKLDIAEEKELLHQKKIQLALSQMDPALIDRLKLLDDAETDGATLEDLYNAVSRLRADQDRLQAIKRQDIDYRLMKQLFDLSTHEFNLNISSWDLYEKRPLDLKDLGKVLQKVKQERREQEIKNEKLRNIFDKDGMFYITLPTKISGISFQALMDKIVEFKANSTLPAAKFFTADEIQRVNQMSRALDEEDTNYEHLRAMIQGRGDGLLQSGGNKSFTQENDKLKIKFDFSDLVNK